MNPMIPAGLILLATVGAMVLGVFLGIVLAFLTAGVMDRFSAWWRKIRKRKEQPK